MKYLVLLLIFPFNAFSQNDPYLPNVEPREILVQHTAFSMSYNTSYVLPSWVAYKLTKDMMVPGKEAKAKYIPDPDISDRKADKKDYKGSSYIMSQLVPVEDMLFSEKAQEETYYMSNIIPQKMAFYKYIWSELTKLTHRWVSETSALYIVTGPVLKDAPFGTIGEDKVSVPERYYKVILDKDNNRAIGFVFNNNMSSRTIERFAMSVDKVEEITGIDFFPGLEDDQVKQMEGTLDLKKWDFSPNK